MSATCLEPEHGRPYLRCGHTLPCPFHVTTPLTRDELQHTVYAWAARTFGPGSTLPSERALRLLEEVVELAQAERLPIDQAIAVVRHVYDKPVGRADAEAGAVGVTLLAYCESVGLSADAVERCEVARVLAVDPEAMRARQAVKVAAGIGVRPIQANTGSGVGAKPPEAP